MAEILPDGLEPEEGTLLSDVFDAGGRFYDVTTSPISTLDANSDTPTSTEKLSFLQGLTTPDREDNVLTGDARELYDWAFDYSGTWGGMEDQHDVHGPSWDPRDDPGEQIDWRNDSPSAVDEDDPFRQLLEWIVANPGKVVAAILLLYVLPLLASSAEVAANLTEN